MPSLLKKYTAEKRQRLNSTRNRIAKESTLVDIFHKSIQLKEKDFIAFEFETSNGIADLVLCRLRKDWRKYNSLRLVDPRWVYALVALPYRKEFTLNEFSKLAGASLERSRKALKQYESAGFCSQIENGNWTKIRQPRPLINNCCAIEAKLSDWRKALSQAFRYYDFSNESWVVLDEANAKTAAINIHEFRRLNVGLATVDTFGNISKIFSPKTTSYKSKISFWYANSRVAKALTP